jgi:hypothetical protein
MLLQDALKEAYMRAQLLKEPCYVLQEANCDAFYTLPQKELVATDMPYIKVFSAGFYEIVNQGLVHGGFNGQRNTNSDAIGGNSHPPVSTPPVKPEQCKPDTRQNTVKVRYDAFTGFAY